jgi:hypothetical protein
MSRGGIKKEIIESGIVELGDNEFETSLITVPANSTITKGTVLKRDGEKFAPVTINTETPIAVNPCDIENKGTAAADMSLRAIISGPVRAASLTINGQPLTAAQRDMLRDHALIIPVLDHDISRTE